MIAVIVIIGAAAGGSSAKKVSSSDGASQGVSSNTIPSSDKPEHDRCIGMGQKW